MSYTLPINSQAPYFQLLSTEGKTCSLTDFQPQQGLVVFFTCNHCPYVIGSNENTRILANQYSLKGFDFVGINSNSPNTYSEDSYEHMVDLMKEQQYPWTYLVDSDQTVAQAYGALKTPHFYLFNKDLQLVYTGRSIDTPRDHTQSTTHELQDAMEDLIHQRPIQHPITNPIGCNIKWEGKPRHWMPPEACDLV